MHKLFCYLNSLGEGCSSAQHLNHRKQNIFSNLHILKWHLLLQATALLLPECLGIYWTLENKLESLPRWGTQYLTWIISGQFTTIHVRSFCWNSRELNTNNPSVAKQIVLLTESCLAPSADLAATKWYLSRWDLLKFPKHIFLCLLLA